MSRSPKLSDQLQSNQQSNPFLSSTKNLPLTFFYQPYLLVYRELFLMCIFRFSLKKFFRNVFCRQCPMWSSSGCARHSNGWREAAASRRSADTRLPRMCSVRACPSPLPTGCTRPAVADRAASPYATSSAASCYSPRARRRKKSGTITALLELELLVVLCLVLPRDSFDFLSTRYLAF